MGERWVAPPVDLLENLQLGARVGPFAEGDGQHPVRPFRENPGGEEPGQLDDPGPDVDVTGGVQC
jgi:hypothetical protein